MADFYSLINLREKPLLAYASLLYTVELSLVDQIF